MMSSVRTMLLSLCAASASAESLPPNVVDTTVAQNLSNPSAMTAAPDGRIFIGEQPGTIWLLVNGVRLSQAFMSLPSDGSSDRGIECILCDPNFSINHRLYIYFTHLEPAGTPEFNCIWTVDATANTAGATTQIWQGDPLSQTYCNGGGMVFGPDGDLYVANGDNDVDANAQSMTTTLGKVLRLNSDGTIPTDDPYYGTETGPEQAIYCLGLRNPYIMSVQPGSGLIYLDDVRGTDNDQYVCQVSRAANFGYPISLGATASPPYTSPLIAIPYGNSVTSSHCISGGCFLTSGSQGFPGADVGLYYFCDYSLGWVWTYSPSSKLVSTFAQGLDAPIQLTQDPAGNLWYISRGDFSVHEISYTGAGGGTTTGTATTTSGTSTGTATATTTGTATGTGTATATGTASTTSTTGTSAGSTGANSGGSASSGCGVGASVALILAISLIWACRDGLQRACRLWWLHRPWAGDGVAAAT